VKFLPAQLAYVLHQGDMRRNLRALALYLGFLILIILLYTVLFHWIMWEVEARRHSWLTGLYWTLTVMSTLGFGDITFTSDVGRAFSVVVLVSGVVLLLIVFPFAFISFFYAPWLEARLRTRAPRNLSDDTEGHVVFAAYDSVAEGLGRKLRLRGIPWYVLEPDPRVAANLLDDGVPAVAGHIGRPETWRGMRADRARLVVANRDDPADSSLALALREVSDVMLIAIAEDPDAIDILELSGCDHALHLKGRLGEHLAARVDAGIAGAHVVGTFRDQAIAEFTVHGTPLANRTLRDTQLREITGLNVVGVWRRGRLEPSHPDLVLSDYSVPVVVGTRDQLTDLESLLVIHQSNFHPVVVIGGGMVGSSTVRALHERKIPVHVVEKERDLAPALEAVADRVVIGDAADRAVLDRAGIGEAPSVVLTTNDDSMNAYLAVYCRRLNPDLRIVSRVTEEQNVEALYRAGADFVLSYATLGAQAILALLDGRELVVIGEGTDFFRIPVPPSLVGKTLAESEIGTRTGMNVVALDLPSGTITNPAPDTRLEPDGHLVMIGTMEQRSTFAKEHER
jgi:Trk K+ transport system NAD-binding subunit